MVKKKKRATTPAAAGGGGGGAAAAAATAHKSPSSASLTGNTYSSSSSDLRVGGQKKKKRGGRKKLKQQQQQQQTIEEHHRGRSDTDDIVDVKVDSEYESSGSEDDGYRHHQQQQQQRRKKNRATRENVNNSSNNSKNNNNNDEEDDEEELDEHAGKYRVVHGGDPKKNSGFKDNRVKNTKYTALNFVPKQLSEQFSLHMNRYFLLIACLQLISILTPVNPITTWGPLLVIFSITAVKEWMDDRARGQEDRKANEAMFDVSRNGAMMKIMSQDIRVGDILRLEEGGQFPCDVVLLGSSSPDGVVYIQTANLDGETDFKPRYVVKPLLEATKEKGEDVVSNFRGVVLCAPPNASVYKFDSRMWLEPSPRGSLEPPTSDPIPLSGEQLIQQTTTLQNTDYVYGLAVYTGMETKYGMNRGETPTKYTKVDKFINMIAIIIFIFQLVLVVVFGAIGNALRFGDEESMWYLADPSDSEWYHKLVIPLRFLLLNSTMIPISLKVTLDLCKILYAKFIHVDVELFDPVSGERAYPKNTSISEDLGQTQYILSDKTGTLTQNTMEFSQCSVGDRSYSQNDCREDGPLARAIKNGSKAEIDMMRNFALNNSVVPTVKNGMRQFRAASPDEVALVKAAERFGVSLHKRDGPRVTLKINGKVEKWRSHAVLEFSSTRKRMSVVVENEETKELRLFIKGADDKIIERLAKSEDPKPMMVHLEAAASLGLRTLVYAQRPLSRKEFDSWSGELKEAQAAMEDRQGQLARVYKLLEKNFVLQGSSAIEDKLQDQVPETIQLLRDAGIKFWMLTGDKYSTALQIATSCNLKANSRNSHLFSIEGTSKRAVKRSIAGHLQSLRELKFVPKDGEEDAEQPTILSPRQRRHLTRNGDEDDESHGSVRLHQVSVDINDGDSDSSDSDADGDDENERKRSTRNKKKNKKNKKKRKQPRRNGHTNANGSANASSDDVEELVVIIRGATLEFALRYCKEDFSRLCLKANSVVCCRVTPKQKAQLVHLVHDAGKMTLAIGDGGNDVEMIHQANVGVGIRGKEGLQASRAADYAVSYFKDLQRLVLVHGRYSYVRTSLVAQYSFYKSFLFCTMQICFGFVSYFSGATLFNSLCITSYNALLFVPIVTFVLDKDVQFETVFKFPQLYIPCMRSEYFNYRTMGWWMVRGLLQGLLIFLVTVLTRGVEYTHTVHGSSEDWETMGIVAFCAYLWVQAFTMVFELHNITAITMYAIWGFHALNYLILIFTNAIMSFNSLNGYWIVFETLNDGQSWFHNLLVTVACLVPVTAIQYHYFNYRPRLLDHLMYWEKNQGRNGGDVVTTRTR